MTICLYLRPALQEDFTADPINLDQKPLASEIPGPRGEKLLLLFFLNEHGVPVQLCPT